MKKFTSVRESANHEEWVFVAKVQFEGFEMCEMTGTVKVDPGTLEGDVGEIIDKKMDALMNLVNYEIISIDKK